MENRLGLTQKEADNLLKEYGLNELKDTNHLSALKIFLHQIKGNFIVYLLLFAAIISIWVEKDITGYVILAVIVMVVVVGFIQEFRAEQAVSSLRKMIMPTSIVIRDGVHKELPSTNLVPGDIVILRNGERVPADCLILEEKELRLDEAVLTGESKEIKKTVTDTPESADEENFIFMGTYLINGRCVAKVIHTGMNTRFGKIAGLISSAEKELPLQNKVNKLSKYMVIAGIVVSLLTGLLMIFRAETLNYETMTEILILIIALSVSVFPEGLPVVLITTLATGAARMAKQNAIVNRMSIIETLGETTVVCSDKTGTLTKGEMTVKQIYTHQGLIDVSGSGYDGNGELTKDNDIVNLQENKSLNILFKTAVLCNDAKIERTGEDLDYRVIGTPTEGALMVLSVKGDVYKEDINAKRIEEMPFSSDRKMMSVLCEEGESYVCYAKGAPEVLLAKCSYFYKHNGVEKLEPDEKEKILEVNRQMNGKAFRTLALAYKPLDSSNANYKEDELVFLGLVGMEDPPREEVIEALELCKSAGIVVKMITGDNKDTALSISTQIGLEGEVIEGKDIDNLSDEELLNRVKYITIFARVRPDHKLRIVKALKQNGEIVTMTGDGVNDAPALKEAHIGVAMGKNGTDVSRSVADLTLKDDNFATIIYAIKEGRTIFNNIRKFISYQLSCNLAEVIVIFVSLLISPLLGWQVPILLAIHILFMNLVTDDLPAITLGLNPSSKDIMKAKPRRKAALLNKPLYLLILFNGAFMAIMTLFVYFTAFNIFHFNHETSRTTALVTLILLEIASAFNFRSFRNKVINRHILANRYLVYASLLSFCATLLVTYTGINTAFGTVPLGWINWLFAAVSAVIILLFYDFLKYYSQKKHAFLSEIV